MNPFEMVIGIVLITGIVSIVRAKYGYRRNRYGDELPLHDPDTARLREEVQRLKDRIAVLERIATDNDRSLNLDREIEALRSRD